MKDDILAPPTPAEEKAAESLRQALEHGAPADADEIVRTATSLAATGAPFLPELAAERVRRRMQEAAAARRRSRWKRAAWSGLGAAAVAASVLLWMRSAPVTPAPPYERVFAAPFARDARPVERIERILAWRRGRLEESR